MSASPGRTPPLIRPRPPDGFFRIDYDYVAVAAHNPTSGSIIGIPGDTDLDGDVDDDDSTEVQSNFGSPCY